MENILECPICMMRFDNNEKTPRLLPCQHNLCTQCLNQLKALSKNGPSLNCPECRALFSSKLELIPKSLVLCQIVELGNNLGQNSQDIKELGKSLKISAKKPIEKPWNFRTYLRSVFNEIDANGDGSITANELENVLKNVNSNTKFDPKTVALLIKIHDRNGDNEISFDEFFDLHSKLNEDWETFLITDADSSGGIDPEEFSNLLKSKGYSLSSKFFTFFFNNLFTKLGKMYIEFDIYIRVSARLEYLLKLFHTNNYYYRNFSIENYLENYFFKDENFF